MQKDKPHQMRRSGFTLVTHLPFRPNGFFHSIILDKSILPLRDVRLIVSQLFDIKIGVSFKQTVKTMIR